MEKTITDICTRLTATKKERDYLLCLLFRLYDCVITTHEGREEYFLIMKEVEALIDDFHMKRK